ncbi:TAXI family TRAP transporter solute-binding subunit [Tistrella bauzanensis]|jgi:TRAP transporter TAXI family solute receptor|uniref:TAXI family TRAP transporter solute-binding subunit n=1 Tax=Tistrella bauzanensis TaxID=657419 RepID=UPI0031FADB8A
MARKIPTAGSVPFQWGTVVCPGRHALGRYSLGRRATALAASLLAGLFMLLPPQIARAQDEAMRFFRIGTGSTAGTYFPIGGILANAVSNPPGSRPCEDGGACGVPGLVAVAVTTRGSVDNLRLLAAGQLDSALSQADVAVLAQTGRGAEIGAPLMPDLRAIASLYPESLHLVARNGSGISDIKDLVGKRVSLDRTGSGSLVDARLVLAAAGIPLEALAVENLDPEVAVDHLRDGSLDAFFFVGGYPAVSIGAAIEDGVAGLVPLSGALRDELVSRHPFFVEDVIPRDAYNLPAPVGTVSVRALWVVREGLNPDLVYGLTRALWSAPTRSLLDAGHAKGRLIRVETANLGVGVPLHEGAARFYREWQAALDAAAAAEDADAATAPPDAGATPDAAGREEQPEDAAPAAPLDDLGTAPIIDRAPAETAPEAPVPDHKPGTPAPAD